MMATSAFPHLVDPYTRKVSLYSLHRAPPPAPVMFPAVPCMLPSAPPLPLLPRPRPALSLVVTMRRDRAKMLTYRWDPHPATLLDHLHSQLAEEGPKQVRRVFVKHA